MKKQTDQNPIQQKVLKYIREHNLVDTDNSLLVAVSGGADSVCLLHVLFQLKTELGADLHVAHLNHCLRGAESDADARYVAELASQLGIPFTIEDRDVKGYKEKRGVTLEEAAREVRYAFLSEVSKSIRAKQVAVGHTMGDNVETILLHIIRGSGTRGLQGLQPVVTWQTMSGDITVIRPLLCITRHQTEQYCDSYQLQPCLDTSNLSLSPLRNRLRYQLLPLLEKYNPRVNEAILRTAGIAGDDLAFLDAETRKCWDKIALRERDTVVLEKERFLGLQVSLRRNLLRMAIGELAGNLKDIESRHIEILMDALDKPAGKMLYLPDGLFFYIEYNRYLLTKKPESLSPFSSLKGEYTLNIPGETVIPGWIISAEVIQPERVKLGEDNYTAYFDFDKSGKTLSVRARKTGNRFQPMGLPGFKKVGQFMIDEKIPRTWRPHIPVVCSEQQIMWIVGWRIDDRVKVTENTSHVLRLHFEAKI